MKLVHLITIGGVNIMGTSDGSYVQFLSDLDICNDGTGPDHGDPHHIKATAYRPYLNADHDDYIVTPPQIRKLVKPKVLGCLGRVTNTVSHVQHDGVVGEVGPEYTTGEVSYHLAKKLRPSVTHNSGDKRKLYLYEFWPGTPAKVQGKTYKLL